MSFLSLPLPLSLSNKISSFMEPLPVVTNTKGNVHFEDDIESSCSENNSITISTQRMYTSNANDNINVDNNNNNNKAIAMNVDINNISNRNNNQLQFESNQNHDNNDDNNDDENQENDISIVKKESSQLSESSSPPSSSPISHKNSFAQQINRSFSFWGGVGCKKLSKVFIEPEPANNDRNNDNNDNDTNV